ncbi:MAG: hypothetical protein P8M03_05415 [Flavobacteriaceae bacterium]|nr:hypothetical protein [Flavobacteriaceae bacterium]
MKKILLTLFLLPLILLSQRVDNYGITPSHEKNRKTGKINKDSDYIADYKTNPLHTGWIKKQINEGTLEKSYDQNGRLRYEFFTSNNQHLKSYQRFWNKNENLVIETYLNINGSKDGIETIWKYDTDGNIYKKLEIKFSDGEFISSKTFSKDKLYSEIKYLKDNSKQKVVKRKESKYCESHKKYHYEDVERIFTFKFYQFKYYENFGDKHYKRKEFSRCLIISDKWSKSSLQVGKERSWWSNGRLEEEKNFYTNENFVYYYDRSKVSGNYKMLDGFHKKWTESGQLIFEANYKDNKPIGTIREFFKNGVLKTENTHFYQPVVDTPSRNLKTYHENGTLHQQTNYNLEKGYNVKNGEDIEYDKIGKIIQMNYYLDGKIIEKNRFDSTGQLIMKSKEEKYPTKNKITYKYYNKKVYEIEIYKDSSNEKTIRTVINSYYKNGNLATSYNLENGNNKRTRWFINGEKEYEIDHNNEKRWKENKLLYNINWDNDRVVVNNSNKTETDNFLNYSRNKSGVITSKIPMNIKVFNSPYGEVIGEYKDYGITEDFQFDYEEYGVTYYDNINGFLRISPSLWIKSDNLSYDPWIAFASYGFAEPPGLVLRSEPDSKSKRIMAFQGEEYLIEAEGKLTNGYKKVIVSLYDRGGYCEGKLIETWEGWIKIISDDGTLNIYWYPRGC